jgi:hypothetical protein
MIETTRRFFLFGSAAALAVASLPKAIETIAPVGKTSYDRKFAYRSIHDIWLGLNSPAADGSKSMGFDIGYNEFDNQIFQWRINQLGSYRWVAMPGNELILDPNRTLRLGSDAPVDGLHVDFVYDAGFDEPHHFLESFEIKDGIFLPTHPPMPLDPRDENYVQPMWSHARVMEGYRQRRINAEKRAEEERLAELAKTPEQRALEEAEEAYIDSMMEQGHALEDAVFDSHDHGKQRFEARKASGWWRGFGLFS